MGNYEILANDIEKELKETGRYSTEMQKIIEYMRSADVEKITASKTAGSPNAEKEMQKPLKDLLIKNGCKSLSDNNEVYSILAPIAFDITPANKDTDIARRGIYGMFASQNITNAIIEDMTQRFIDDKGMTEKYNKIYYELLTKTPNSQENFSRLYCEEIPFVSKMHISINPHNDSKFKPIFIDAAVSNAITNNLLRDSNIKNMCTMAKQGSFPVELQKKVIDKCNKKRPVHGAMLLMQTMLESEKIPIEVLDYAIQNAKTADAKLDLCITKITIEKGYRNNINTIGANIRSGYSDDFITLFNSFKEGGFPYQKETREVVNALKDLDAIKQDEQTMNLLLSKEKMLIDAEENRNQYYVLSAGRYVDAIIDKATRFKFVPALYVEIAINNADMYAEAKRVMEADLDKDALLDEIEEDEEREAKNADKDPYEDR